MYVFAFDVYLRVFYINFFRVVKYEYIIFSVWICSVVQVGDIPDFFQVVKPDRYDLSCLVFSNSFFVYYQYQGFENIHIGSDFTRRQNRTAISPSGGARTIHYAMRAHDGLILRKRLLNAKMLCIQPLRLFFSILYCDDVLIIFLYEDSCITLGITAPKQESSLGFLISREGESVCVLAI